MKKIELLAPAGDLERLKIALLYGADAVYIGGEYNLRANATNFSLDDIEKGVNYAHKLNKKVYVAVNIAFHNQELKGILDYLKELDKRKVDAIIVSDPCVIDLALKNTNLEVHLSTQNSTLNSEAIKFWKKKGVKRVVLARECNKEDIKKIKEKVNIDLEVFVHGAMCASYSGRCVLSNYLTNRDSNRGGCSQICRWDFKLYDASEVKAPKDFTFCSKDLCMINYVKDLIDLNVNSLKIEGRMRSIYYIASVIRVYRKVIDNYYKGISKIDEKDIIELNKVANRESCPQFFNNIYDERIQYYNGRVENTNQDFIGLVLDYKDNLIKIEERNYFKVGDKVCLFGPNEEYNFCVKEIYDEEKNKIDVVRHPKQIVYLPFPKKISKNFMLKMIDKA